MASRIPIYYTFGNHQHWVDFHWLWGYWVLGEATRDSLKFIRATGTKGCVNFDGIGYEKLAGETPEDLAEIREAVAQGLLEPVGASYGQPYGLFQGGEANVRQLVYGVRAVRKHLGQRPRTFWEEEFYFFPQLPQMLRGVGMPYASLYFQWTWHTPEVPWEAAPVIRWQGLDGSTVLTATRNALNLHQWPEDFQILLDQLAELGPDEVLRRGSADTPTTQGVPPLILQWLELMPSPDWMCRSELMIPMMRKLLEDPRFEVRPCTLGGYLAMVDASGAQVPTRSYAMHDVWHGMSLGKNGYYMRQLSDACERSAQAAESISSLLGLFGRPYPQWDVYPTWEIEEAWRELLMGQHHDNDECERLCGYVGEYSYERSLRLSGHVIDRSLKLLAQRAGLAEDEALLWNPLPWARTFQYDGNQVDLPGLGWTLVARSEAETRNSRRDLLRFDIPGLGEMEGFGEVRYTVEGQAKISRFRHVEGGEYVATMSQRGRLSRMIGPDSWAPNVTHVVICGDAVRPDGGLNAGVKAWFRVHPEARLIADTAYGVGEVQPGPKRLKKYPSGDWMTSSQWFEEIEGNLYSQSFLDVVGPDGSGVMIVHSGASQWFAVGDELSVLLTMADPWDEEHFRSEIDAEFWFFPHGPIGHAERWRLAQELLVPPMEVEAPLHNPFRGVPADLPRHGGIIRCAPDNVRVTALFRETEHAGRGFERYAGACMGYPFVLRLVEFEGTAADVEVMLPGPVARAFRTTLMGEIEAELLPEPLDGPVLPGVTWQRLRFAVRPHEIVTLVVDIEPGRKRFRDLDAHREVWATVHRIDA